MHIQPKEIKRYPFFLRLFFDHQKKKLGQVMIPGLFWGRMPLLHFLFLSFWKYLDRKSSSLSPELRALVQVKVAQINWCEFCIDFNAFNLLKRTKSQSKLDHLNEWRNNDVFTNQDKAALALTETMSSNKVSVPDAQMKELKQYFSDDQIVELIALISFQNMSAKFNAALRIPSQGLCEIPKK